jgi:type IV pilus assembly protein PilW
MKQNKQAGLSLIELMVAITIGAMLLAGAISLLVNNKRIYRNQNEMGRMQENSRFSMDKLITDIRTAGYKGCSHDQDATYNTAAEQDGSASSTKAGSNTADIGGKGAAEASTTTMNRSLFSKDIEGSESGGNWYPSDVANPFTTYGDSITLRYYRGQALQPVAPFMNSTDDPIYIDMPVGYTFEEDDVITISNCNGSDLFRISAPTPFDSQPDGTPDQLVLNHALVNSSGDPSNTHINLSQIYTSDSNATINSLVAKRYFVGDSTFGSGRSLFYAESNDPADAVEMVEGVDTMEILYGVDWEPETVAGSPPLDGYYTAAQVKDLVVSPVLTPDATNPWDRVLTVRITVTFSAVDENALSPEARSMTTTVILRNRSS